MFLKKSFFFWLFSIAAVSVLGLIDMAFYNITLMGLCGLAVAVAVDIAALLWLRIDGRRVIAPRTDLGEENKVSFDINLSRGWFKKAYIIDEIPPTYLVDKEKNKVVKGKYGTFTCSYSFIPTCRGHYELWRALLYVSCLGLLERRMVLEKEGQCVEVYPAFSRLREKEQQVRAKQMTNAGSHKRQLPANQTEFRDIREYVVGDDIRTINWKASARTDTTMVNEYEDERSQHIINVIDCGIAMHRTFNSLSLLDYAINASLLVSYSALESESDCVGVCAYSHKGVDYLPPRAGKTQLNSIIQQLYAIETEYGESDVEQLCIMLDRSVKRRSLVFLYTEIPSMMVLERQLPFLKRISMRNCLVVVNCLDREIEEVSDRNTADKQMGHSQSVERVLAKDMVYQKFLIGDTLQQNGIYSISVHPEQLSYGVLAKYIELKSRRAW